MSDNIIQLNQDLIHIELKDLVKNSVEETLNAMLDAEADKLVQAERYARDEQARDIVPVIMIALLLLLPVKSISECLNLRA